MNFTIIDRNYAISSNGKEWKIDPGNLVDQLSVYLALSIDIQKTPDQARIYLPSSRRRWS